MAHPMHGYKLHQIISTALGPSRTISWGVLYPLIRRLETEGLIEKASWEGEGGGRVKKVYQMNEAGRARFHELMLAPIEYSQDYEDHFLVKMGHFGYLSAAERKLVLQAYQDFLEHQLDHAENKLVEVTTCAEIPELEQPWIVRVLTHRQDKLKVDVEWVTAEIRQLLLQSKEEGKHHV